MVSVGNRPILWHIMKSYAAHGHKYFILCLGYKGEVIREFFLNYLAMTSDLTLRLGRNASVEYHSSHDEEDWSVTLVETGLKTMTGGRFARVLLTGHTGFKGAWLALWLRRLGAEVHGLALPPERGPGLYPLIREDTFKSERMVDLRDFDPLREAIDAVQPQLILHLAAQAIVQTSYRDPLAACFAAGGGLCGFGF